VANQDIAERYDVVVVGGGHNGLTAAAYLARAGKSVLVLERLQRVGGAAVTAQPFRAMPARLSRYSYLVSLLPQQIIDDLGLDLELRSRATSSYSPAIRDRRCTGLFVENRTSDSGRTAESFRRLTGSDQEYDAWRALYAEMGAFAQTVAPTMLEPLVTEREMRERVDPPTWGYLVEQPLGAMLEQRFADDTVRGTVATDALIGTFADLHDPSLVQNKCFLYHLIGNGTGEWRVPVGGMGAVTDALAVAARNAGATIVTGAGVSGIESDDKQAVVTWHDGTTWRSVDCGHVLANVAPWVLQVLLGQEPGQRPEGSQVKINFLLTQLPTLKSGMQAAAAFAGTMHVAEDYTQLQAAYADADGGRLPSVQPGELYCHSLTDPSTLGSLAVKGMHTMTYFGVHTPARLFDGRVEEHRVAPGHRSRGPSLPGGKGAAGRRRGAGDARRPHLPRRSLLAVGQQPRPARHPRPALGRRHRRRERDAVRSGRAPGRRHQRHRRP
jgi:phytoene dehydrogenase-like protein